MFIRLHLPDAEDTKSSLPRYFEILNGNETASYLKCKKYPVDMDFGSPCNLLWEKHDEALRRQGNSKYEGIPKTSLLDMKLKLARQMLGSCELCERRCRVNRFKGKKGHCGVVLSKVSSEFVHWGEEPELVPSHTIFFSGCTFNCVFCQNWDISQNPKNGLTWSPKRVVEAIERRSEITRNTNWVGGDPTSNLPFIIEVLTYCDVNKPQIWNSNMYLTKKSMKLLDGIIDVYLTDFKYGNNQCARRLSNVDSYWEIVTRNHLLARAQCEMIIRHLVLPRHFECCTKPVLKWIADNLENVRVNVMDQFRPEYEAYGYEELGKRLSKEEFKIAQRFARDLGLNLTA